MADIINNLLLIVTTFVAGLGVGVAFCTLYSVIKPSKPKPWNYKIGYLMENGEDKLIQCADYSIIDNDLYLYDGYGDCFGVISKGWWITVLHENNERK